MTKQGHGSIDTERLRNLAWGLNGQVGEPMRAAADEIDRLRAEVAGQRETILRLRSGYKTLHRIAEQALEES